MVDQPISVSIPDSPKLREAGRVLRQGRTKLLGPKGDVAALPKALQTLFQEIGEALAAGQSIVVMPQEKQLTTQQAGELLGLSRPYVIRLLDEGEMPYTLAGKHRRIALRDVLACAQRRADRKEAFDQIARDAYEDGFYDYPSSPGRARGA